MFERLHNLTGLVAVARKAAFSPRSARVDVNNTLVVVLIILVLLSQSGVGLTA